MHFIYDHLYLARLCGGEANLVISLSIKPLQAYDNMLYQIQYGVKYKIHVS